MVVFHKFPTDLGLHRAVPMGKVCMCACMKQLVARAEARPATRAVVGVTGAATQHSGQIM